MNIGDMNVPFLYQGEELIYPNPVKDGLVLWYDFSGMTNEDESKGIARDLSGNGNHGTLQNFNFTPESGYDKNKLLFDGVDDTVQLDNPLINQGQESQYWSVEFVLSVLSIDMSVLLFGLNNSGIQTRSVGDKLRLLNYTDNSGFLYNTHYFDVGEVVHAVFSYDHITKKRSIMLNGVLEDSNIAPDDFMPRGMLNQLTFMYMGSARIYSSRIYNRPLTPEEIAHNYAIEKERFGIE